MLINHAKTDAIHSNIRSTLFLNNLRTRSHRTSINVSATLAMVWSFCGLALALIYSSEEWVATLGVLMISQAFTGRLVWRRFKVTRAAVLPDFLTLVLFIQFGTKTLTGLGIIFRYGFSSSSLVGDSLQRHVSVPMVYQFQAELVFLLATIIFTSVWRLLEGKHILAVWNEPRSSSVWLIYGMSLFFYLVVKRLNLNLGAVEEFLHLFAIGAIAVLLGGSSTYALGNRKAIFSLLALAPLMILALSSGMKGEVAIVIVPLLLPVFRRMTPQRFAFLGVFFVFVILFLFPFNNAWRNANWEGQNRDQTHGIAEVASRVSSSWERNGFIETAAESTASWLSRGSSSELGGLVMQIASRDGLIGPVLIEGLATIFIPRFLWPGKPAYLPGAWFTWYLGMADSPETASSATATMLATELYWMFGLLGVVFGMAFISLLYFKIWRFLVQASVSRLVPIVALFAMFARTGGMEEIHTINAVSSPIILLIYVLIFDRLYRMFISSPRNQEAFKGLS